MPKRPSLSYVEHGRLSGHEDDRPERHVDFETIDPVQDYARAFSMLYGYFPNPTTPIVKEFGIRTRRCSARCISCRRHSAGPSPRLPLTSSSWRRRPHPCRRLHLRKGRDDVRRLRCPCSPRRLLLAGSTFHYLTAVHGPAEKDPDLADWWVGLKLFDATIRWALSPPAVPMAYDPAATEESTCSSDQGQEGALRPPAGHA